MSTTRKGSTTPSSCDTAQAKTFLDGNTVTVDIVGGPFSTGLCKVMFEDKQLARHVDRLTPINEEARKLLQKKK